MDELIAGLLTALAYPFFAAWLVGLGKSRRIDELEDQLESLREKVRQQYVPAVPVPAWQPAEMPAPAPSPVAPTPPPVPEQAPEQVQIHTPPPTAPVAAAPTHEEATAPTIAAVREDYPRFDDEKIEPPRWLVAAKTWLMTGNLVAKLGLVILFIGVGFLIKYVAATVTIPIEVRLAAVVLADFGLLGWGWRMRLTRREIGLPIQGSAIAILMLVIFSASQQFDLIPMGLAFGLLVGLMAFTCLLAVLQEAPWLAAFGITGGFACPLLISSGQGSHISLFSYYAVLNAGVFALAWKRSWHPLNLLGFVFTFVIGGIWGGLRYSPEHYWSAQAFLILFFLCYAAIPLAFISQQRSRTKDYVDVALVMGTPLLAFGFQVGLVKDIELGLAFSALALGGFYLGLGTVLWRSGNPRWRMMIETFCVLGAIFGTLTIPFALDARWTSAAWALEGAGFVWFGLRQQRRLAWVFGLFLQLGAWVSFASVLSGLHWETAQAMHLWLSFLFLSGSAFAVALALRKPFDDELELTSLGDAFLLIAALWLTAGCWTEAVLHVSGSILANWLVVSAMLIAALFYGIGIRMAWPAANKIAFGAQLACAAALGVVSAPGWRWTQMLEADTDMPLLGLVIVATAAFASSRLLQRTPSEPGEGRVATALLVWSGIWWCGPVINVAAGRLCDYLPHFVGSTGARWAMLYAFAIAATTVAAIRAASRFTWPQLHWFATTTWCLLVVMTVEMLGTLYGAHLLPDTGMWVAWAVALAGSEYAMRHWAVHEIVLKSLHIVRTAGPWLALWPTGAILIDRWLIAPVDQVPGEWITDAAWSNYPDMGHAADARAAAAPPPCRRMADRPIDRLVLRGHRSGRYAPDSSAVRDLEPGP